MRWRARGAHVLLAIGAITFSVACAGGGSNAATKLNVKRAEQKLQRIVLAASDIGDGYVSDGTRVQSNDDAAKARPDTDVARRQYAEWGQVLAYNTQFAAPTSTPLVFTGTTARVMNTATIFDTGDGALAALSYIREIPDNVVANFLVNEAGGTKISDVQAVKAIDFASKGDDSFAWRLSGKATFADGFTVGFIADAVFVRSGRVVGNITTVALGEAPDRAQLERLVDAFVAKAGANG